MSDIKISSVVVSLILIAVISSGMLMFGGGLMSEYDVELDTTTNESIQNFGEQTEGIVDTAEDIYESSLNSTNDEVGLLNGVTVWVGSSISAVTTAMGSLVYVENLGGVLTSSLGIPIALSSLIILAITTILIFKFIGIMLGRDKI